MYKRDNSYNPKSGGCLVALLLIPLQLLHWAIMIPVSIVVVIVAAVSALFGGRRND
jgi:hypothetical protein